MPIALSSTMDAIQGPFSAEGEGTGSLPMQAFYIEILSPQEFAFLSVFDYQQWNEEENCEECFSLERRDVRFHGHEEAGVRSPSNLYKLEIRDNRPDGRDRITEWNILVIPSMDSHERPQLTFSYQKDKWMLHATHASILTAEQADEVLAETT